MSWRKGIILGMAAFMAFILALGAYMICSKTDDYDHEYYEKGLAFDTDYDMEMQVKADNAQPVIVVDRKGVRLGFKQNAAGTISFRRPSDRRLDRRLNFSTKADGVYQSGLQLPATGRWQLTLEWQSGGKQYLYHQQLYLK